MELESGPFEIGLVILSGECDVRCEGENFRGLGDRKDVFSGKPTTVYIPRDSSYRVTAVGDGLMGGGCL